jgi:VWFA-related protein
MMQRSIGLLLVMISTGISSGQTPTTPQNTPQQETPATIHVDTNLVVVDVTVTDAQKNPVHNLSAADFNLREDGQLQSIKTFDEHTADVAAKPSPNSPPPPHLAPGVFTNIPSVPETGTLNIVLLDKLNTPTVDQAYSIKQLSQYLENAPAGTRIAVVSLTAWQLSLLQGFTSDPGMLRAALSSKDAEASPSALLGAGGSKATPGGGIRVRFRRELTLNALNELARYLSGFPGRKNLIWFSSSFPVSIAAEGNGHWEPEQEEEFKQTVNLFAHNQVAVYPIDTQGLAGNSYFSAANAGAATVAASNAALLNSTQKTATGDSLRRWAMADIADPTGGQAFIDTNDLKGAVSQSIDAGANYYTLTYSPTNHNWNEQLRKIEIKLAREGYTLTYRRGYYAINPNAPQPSEQKAANTELPPFNAMRAAMVRGAPEPTEIRFEASVRPAIADAEPALAPGNQGNPKISGPYRRYTVRYIAHQRDIDCPSAPGDMNLCTIHFIASVYDTDGLLIVTQANELKTNIKSAYYNEFRQPGHDPAFQFQQDISVPAKGAYYLRVGIHDMTSNRVGALELPVSLVNPLPPLDDPRHPPQPSN